VTNTSVKGLTKKPGPGGTRAHAQKAGAQCGARRKGGGHCTLAAGWGTKHSGIGKCKFHGGSTTTHVKAAASAEIRLLLGRPIEINPLDALLMCIRIRAGEVKWLSDRMAELDETAWIEETLNGKQFHVYARERQHAMQDLARYSQMAISLGIAERAVKLAETYGEMLAKLIQGILGDLDLNEEQRAKVPAVVRRHLIALDGGKDETVVQPGEMLELTA
jgi:hypothetical protein